MLRWSRSLLREDDRGSAALEFILAGLVLLVPTVYLIVSLGMIQGQSLGVAAGARHIARAVSTASDGASAQRRADAVLASIVADYGLDPSAVHMTLRCTPAGVTCPAAGSTLFVTVSTTVALPLVPPVLGLDRMASIPVEGSASERVSRYWTAG